MILTTLALSHVNAIISAYRQCMDAIYQSVCEDSNLIPLATGQTTSIVRNRLGIPMDLEIEGHGNMYDMLSIEPI